MADSFDSDAFDTDAFDTDAFDFGLTVGGITFYGPPGVFYAVFNTPVINCTPMTKDVAKGVCMNDSIYVTVTFDD